jgi:hypothetical protein
MFALRIRGLGDGQVDDNQTKGHKWYVDGTNGSDNNSGKSPRRAFAKIQTAITAADDNDTVFIIPKEIAAGATDPGSYSENLIIPAGTSGLKLIGLSNGVAQGAQPQLKVGATTTAAIITVRAPGCLFKGLTINGAGATGGGILLDDDSSTKSAFGTVVDDCYFKNCKSSGAAATGGALYWSANGAAWTLLVKNSHFYDNRAGIVLVGTSVNKPVDVQILNCSFNAGVNTTTDADIALGQGSGVTSVIIDNCIFGTVDVPAYASSPTVARYVDLTGCAGIISRCAFACIVQGTSAKTFKAAGSAALIPATVRIAGCVGEAATDSTVTAVSRGA